MPEIKAIAFDIDGTLYPQWKLLTTSLGFYIKNYSLVRNYWAVRHHLRDPDYMYEAEGRSGLLRHQAELVAQAQHKDPKELEELIRQKVYGDWEESFQSMRLFSGVSTLLEKLKAKGYKLAAMSDFPVDKKLGYFGLAQYWDTAITSEDSGYLKPHPEPFLYLSQQMGLPCDEILYVGNSYRNDVEGAKAVGMHAAHLSPFLKKGSIADFQFYSYKNFLPRLEKFTESLAIS